MNRCETLPGINNNTSRLSNWRHSIIYSNIHVVRYMMPTIYAIYYFKFLFILNITFYISNFSNFYKYPFIS